MAEISNPFLSFFLREYGDSFRRTLLQKCKNDPAIALRSIQGDISSIASYQPVDLEYKHIEIESISQSEIEFVVDVSFIVDFATYTMLKNKNARARRTFSWNSVVCRATIGEIVENIELLSIKPYPYKPQRSHPLTGMLVPVISSNDYRRYAEELLAEYYPEALRKNWAGSIECLPEKMGIQWKTACLSDDMTVFGKILFKPAKVATFVVDKGRIEKLIVWEKPNTILVDPTAASKANLKTINETIAHECVHYYLHRKAATFACLLDSDYEFVDYVVTDKNKKSERSFMETQAYGIAPFLAMPTPAFKTFVDRELSKSGDLLKNGKSIIRKIADRFGVPLSSVKRRLLSEGYTELAGVLEFTDGRYIPPIYHSPDSGGLELTQTISSDQLFQLFCDSQEFRNYLHPGLYIFIENHLVLNDSKYVKNVNGRLYLTDYARNHPQECCLVFKQIKNADASSAQNEDWAAFNRDRSIKLNYRIQFIKEQALGLNNVSTNLDQYQNQEKQALSLIYGKDFGQALDELMKYLDIPRKELASDTGLSFKTISRYLKNESVPQKHEFLRICIALEVSESIFDELRKKVGIDFDPLSKADNALRLVFAAYQGSSKNSINEFLISKGFNPLY